MARNKWRAYRTGIIRKLDIMNRVVLSKDHVEFLGVGNKTAFMMSVLVDHRTGKQQGILLEPLAWVLDPSLAPTYDESLRRLYQIEGEGPDISLLGPDITL